MSMKIEIILAKPDHAHAIAYIGRSSFRDAFGSLFNNRDELEEYLEYTYNVEKITASLRKSNNQYFLALADGSPVGFSKLKKHSLNEQIDLLVQTELQKLYVLKPYHGKGVGGALMNSVVKFVEAIEPDCLWLDTHITNERAISFYQRHGFAKSGTHQFTIGTQTFDYFLMALPVCIPLAS